MMSRVQEPSFDGLVIPEFFVNRLLHIQDLGACVRFYWGCAAVGRMCSVPTYASVWAKSEYEPIAIKIREHTAMYALTSQPVLRM